MNLYRFSRIGIVSGVLGAMVLIPSPAAAQSRTFHPMVFRTTTPLRITNFNSPHAAVPVQRARAVVIDPFLHTPVVSLNGNGSVVAFNPFIRTNALITFPDAHTVLDPFRVPVGDFRKDLPNHGRSSLSSMQVRELRGRMYAAMLYADMMYGGYGMGGYGSGGYGGGYGGGGGGSASGSGYQPPVMTSTTPAENPTATANAEWPIGLRVLPPTADTDRVRQQLQADLEALSFSPSAEQATALKANAMQEIKTLRRRLDDVGYKLASGTVADARRFLDQVEASLKTVP